MRQALRRQLIALIAISLTTLYGSSCGSGTPAQISVAPPTSPPAQPEKRAAPQTESLPWIAPALRLDRKIYALRNPSKSKLPSTAKRLDDVDLEVFQHIYLGPESPVSDGARVTLVHDTETCVGTIAGQVDIFMACTYEESIGEYTKRQGLRIEGCPSLENSGPYEFRSWAVEGAHPDVSSRPLEEVAPAPERDDGLLDQLIAYASKRSLPEAEQEALEIVEVKRIPGFPSLLVQSSGPEYPRLHLVDGPEVVRHFPERFTARRFMTFEQRLYVFVSTEAECRNVFTAQDNDLVPFNEDCLYLYCGDGLY